MDCIATKYPGAPVNSDVRTVRQGLTLRDYGSFREWTDSALVLQHRINGSGRTAAVWKCFAPGVLESDVIGVAALCAGPVTVGKRHGFVQKKQLGVLTRLHKLAVSPSKFESTRDPAADLPVPNHPLVRGVQAPAVSHERSALGNGNDFAKGRNAILKRHFSAGRGQSFDAATQQTEFVVLDIRHDDPADVVPLSNIHAARAESKQSAQLVGLVSVGRVDVDVDAVLHRFAFGHLDEDQRWNVTARRRADFDFALWTAVDDGVVEDRRPELSNTFGVDAVDYQFSEAGTHGRQSKVKA
jgi:hypothetical protein